jgi:hypothetical protein
MKFEFLQTKGAGRSFGRRVPGREERAGESEQGKGKSQEG